MALTTHNLTINAALPDGTPARGRVTIGVSAAQGIVLDNATLGSNDPGWRGATRSIRIDGQTETIPLPATGQGSPAGWTYWLQYVSAKGDFATPPYAFTLTGNKTMNSVIAGGMMVNPIGVFTGTGNPNGVVTAGRGAEFINTENGGYNGATKWRKDTNGTDTGWRVIDGATPAITLTPTLTGTDQNNTGNLYAYRTPHQFNLVFSGLLLSQGSGILTLANSLPVGLRAQLEGASRVATGEVTRTNGRSSFNNFIVVGGQLQWRSETNTATGAATTARPTDTLTGMFSVPTDDDWPAP